MERWEGGKVKVKVKLKSLVGYERSGRGRARARAERSGVKPREGREGSRVEGRGA